MRKTILIMLLTVVSNSVKAEWDAVGIAENNSTTGYADPATIRKNGDLVKMWGLDDYKTAQVSSDGKAYLSSMVQEQYDCKEEQRRILAISYHSGNMGRGDVVFSGSDLGKWEPVAPRSKGEVFWKFACGKQ